MMCKNSAKFEKGMAICMSKTDEDSNRTLHPYLSQIDVWALSVGSAIGWGSFVMPGTTFLPVAGPLGTALGIGLGMFVMLIIAINYNYLINLYPDYIHCIFTHYSQQFQNYEKEGGRTFPTTQHG